MRRLSDLLLLATLALLPWGGLLAVPRLHPHAQWSDLLCAAAVLAWLLALVLEKRLPQPRPVQGALALYLAWAGLSYLAAATPASSGAAKLLGMGMLLALFVLTSDAMQRDGMARAVGRTVAATSLLTALAAIAGVALAASGIGTPLVGSSGDLAASFTWRAQAGFSHPNLLASYCVFAAGVVARPDAGLPRALRRVVELALALAVLLSTSRAILGFALALAVRQARTPLRRGLAWGLAAVLVVVMGALSAVNLRLDPRRPWQASLSPQPSARALAASSSCESLWRHPLFGSGPGSSPGRRGEDPFDAHLTPLNVAATLGLPALLALVLALALLWRGRARPTDLVTWGMLAGLGLDALGQDVEDFRHVWVALGLADAGRRVNE